tara:strand:+ start:1752 stop:1976 length:225 start_codon:yes stop_codon:yes gene_type:complete
MKIVMLENGDGAIQFTDQEVKILAEKKELIFPVESMVKLSNELVHIGFLMSDKIPKDKQGFSTSSENMPIKNKK